VVLDAKQATINGVVGIQASGEEGEFYSVEYDKLVWAVEGKVKGKAGTGGRVGVNIIPLVVGRIEEFPVIEFKDNEGKVKGSARTKKGTVFTCRPQGEFAVELSHSF